MTAELEEDGQLAFAYKNGCLGPLQRETISVSLLKGVSLLLRVGGYLPLPSAPAPLPAAQP